MARKPPSRAPEISGSVLVEVWEGGELLDPAPYPGVTRGDAAAYLDRVAFAARSRVA
jgi:hypothetical protein